MNAKDEIREYHRKLANECLAIEKQGGDVLGFLRANKCYSAGTTWQRLQKEYLKRKDHQLTSGKPKAGKEASCPYDQKEWKIVKMHEETEKDETIETDRTGEEEKEDEAETARAKRPNYRNRVPIAKEAARAAINGEDPFHIMEKYGYNNPQQAWYECKRILQKQDPELYSQIPKKRAPEACEKWRNAKKANEFIWKPETEAIRQAFTQQMITPEIDQISVRYHGTVCIQKSERSDLDAVTDEIRKKVADRLAYVLINTGAIRIGVDGANKGGENRFLWEVKLILPSGRSVAG